MIELPRSLTVLAVAGLVGCSAGAQPTSAREDSGADENDVTSAKPPSAAEAKSCAQGTVQKDANGDPIVLCTLPFDTAPGVRPPADDLTGPSVSFYAGVTLPTDYSGTFVLWTRTGDRYVVVDGAGAPIPFASGSKLPKALHAPTNRATFTIYQFRGTLQGDVDSPYGKATGIKLSAARPVIELDGCVVDSRLLGTWTGTASERLPKPTGNGPFVKSFDATKRVPFHVTLTGITKAPALSDFKPGSKLKDQATFLLDGQIDDFATLQAMGEKNPFYGAKDGKVQLYRLGNMHGQMNDGHWVLTYPAGSGSLTGNGMSFTLTSFTAPALLLQEGVDVAALQSVEILPHIPYTNNGHTVVLTPEKIGGQTGQCSGNAKAAEPPPDGSGAGAASCAHAECVGGAALEASCSACATAVCAADDFCCSTSWDSTCVGEVAQICGAPCP